MMLLMAHAALAQGLAMIVAVAMQLMFNEPVITIGAAVLCGWSMGVATGRELTK